MTQSGQTKKPTSKVETKPEVIEEPPKGASKTKLALLLEELKEKKPTTYEQYKKAIEQKKPAWVYPDLTVRIG